MTVFVVDVLEVVHIEQGDAQFLAHVFRFLHIEMKVVVQVMAAVALRQRVAQKAGVLFLQTPYFTKNALFMVQAGHTRDFSNHFQRIVLAVQADALGENDKGAPVEGFDLRAGSTGTRNLAGKAVITAG